MSDVVAACERVAIIYRCHFDTARKEYAAAQPYDRDKRQDPSTVSFAPEHPVALFIDPSFGSVGKLSSG